MRIVLMVTGMALTLATVGATGSPPPPASHVLACAATSRAQVEAALRGLRVVTRTGDRFTAKKVLDPRGVALFGVPSLRVELVENHLDDGEITENSYYFTTTLAAKPQPIMAGMANIPGATCRKSPTDHLCTFAGAPPKYMALREAGPGLLSLKCTYMFD